MKKAVLMDFGLRVRMIIETDNKRPDQFDDEYIERGWKKALKEVQNMGALDAFLGAEEDFELPYEEENDDIDQINIIYNDK